MAVYPKKIGDALQGMSFAGKVSPANAVGTGANFACGSFVRFHLHIDPDTKEILSIGFESNGCGFMLAGAEAVARECARTRLTELRGAGRGFLSPEVSGLLGEFPDDRAACGEAVVDALESAFADFRAMQIEEFRGETALVCTCFGVSEDRVNEVIASTDAASLEDVTRACNAGGGCGSCRMLIQELLESA